MMNADIIKKGNNQADVTLSISLQVPQGDRLELKVEQSQCSFYLNETVVQQIQQAQKTGLSLYIPPKLVIPFWYYTCFSNNDVLVKKKETIEKQFNQAFYVIVIVNILKFFLIKNTTGKTTFQPGITFNSYYKQTQSSSDSYEEEDIILQSAILIHGDIFHKIKLDFMENSNCSIIVSAHYWLTEQILSSFRTNLNLLVWELASLLPAALVVYNLYLPNWVLSIFAWIGFTVLFVTTRYFLVNQLQKRTSINSKSINRLIWTLISFIPSVVVGATSSFSNINALLLPFLSLLSPKLAEYILNFIGPRLGKLIIRRFV
ncbi:MAG: hypothetical protein V7K50_23465 [Nostoc sp.]|uniref:hypothetical protein n=1 Tax=Nostoc sp. TaxID=1180 RepID=UPI002FF47D16